jgi:protein required for attachment to host cells
MNDTCKASQDLRDHQAKQDQPSAAQPDQIKMLAAEKVADEIVTRGALYLEALAGEGRDQGEEAQLAGTIYAAYVATGEMRDILAMDVGKLILASIDKHVMPDALQQAETELQS